MQAEVAVFGIDQHGIGDAGTAIVSHFLPIFKLVNHGGFSTAKRVVDLVGASGLEIDIVVRLGNSRVFDQIIFVVGCVQVPEVGFVRLVNVVAHPISRAKPLHGESAFLGTGLQVVGDVDQGSTVVKNVVVDDVIFAAVNCYGIPGMVKNVTVDQAVACPVIEIKPLHSVVEIVVAEEMPRPIGMLFHIDPAGRFIDAERVHPHVDRTGIVQHLTGISDPVVLQEIPAVSVRREVHSVMRHILDVVVGDQIAVT